jgi:hypothetical protein
MTHRLKLLLVGTGLLFAAPAFAQGAGDASGGAAPTGGDASGGATNPAVSATTAPAGGWTQLNDRPLVIPMGKLDVHGGLPIIAIGGTNAMGQATTTTAEAMSIGATFGAMDKLEVGGDYAFELNPNASAKGLITFHGAYAAMKSGKMELAVAGALNISMVGVDAMNNTLTDLSLGFGAWFRYQVMPKVSIFTGQPAIPSTLGGFSAFRAPPIGYQLAIGLNNSGPIALSLPVGAGFQATPQIYAFAGIDLADIYLSNGPPDGKGGNKSAMLIFADMIPLGLGAWYSANDKLDVGVNFADDLKNAGDIYMFTLAGRYYVK